MKSRRQRSWTTTARSRDAAVTTKTGHILDATGTMTTPVTGHALDAGAMTRTTTAPVPGGIVTPKTPTIAPDRAAELKR
jgi:hypothetical protein